MRPPTIPVAPGADEAWLRLATRVAEELPVGEIDGIWIFRPVMRDGRQWGTAVLTRVDGDRRRIYTARYTHRVKGKERGEYEAEVQEVGSGPQQTLEEIFAAVERRSDEEPPVRIPTERWFPAATTLEGPSEDQEAVEADARAPGD